MNKLTAGCIAEFIGTFALTFFGAGAIILTTTNPESGANLLTVALAHGLVLMVFVSGAMYISGGQFNPAVSIGVLLAGKQDAKQAVAFIISQCLGSASGAGMLVLFLGTATANSDAANLGATLGSFTTEGADTVNLMGAFGLEVITTFALMWVILTCLVDGRAPKLGGIPVGLTVAMCILVTGPLTGASMNPARSLGPALYGHWDFHWLYWAAPILGAAIATILWKMSMEAKEGDV